MVIQVKTLAGAEKVGLVLNNIQQIQPQSGGRATRFVYGSGNQNRVDIKIAYSTVMDTLKQWLNPSIGAHPEMGSGPNYTQDWMIELTETS